MLTREGTYVRRPRARPEHRRLLTTCRNSLPKQGKKKKQEREREREREREKERETEREKEKERNIAINIVYFSKNR